MEDLRLKGPASIGEHPDVGGQVVVHLHEPQGDEAVEPGVGHLLHHLVIALLGDGVEQVPALLLFLCREGLAIDGGCTGLPGSLGGDAILVGPLGHLGEEFLPGPHGEGLDGFLVHGDSLL